MARMCCQPSLFILLLGVLAITQVTLASVPILQRTNVRTFQRSDQCIKGGPVQHLNWDAGAWLNIFIDMPFTCSGVTTGYEFYARTTGNLFIGVWRPTRDATHARLIAKDVIPLTWTGAIRAHVPEESQLPFRAGDWLGVHYDAQADDYTGGIIPYEDSRRPICCGMTQSDLGRIHNSYHRDSDLPVGIEIPLEIVDGVDRIPALQPKTKTGGGGGGGGGGGPPPLPPTTTTTTMGPPLPPTTTTTTVGPPPLPNPTCGVPAITPNTDYDRIVGGRPATPHSLPWMASMRKGDYGGHFCGGSLVNNQWVITASHCTPAWSGAAASERQIVLGDHIQSQNDNTEQRLDVHYVFDHPDYDISLLRLERPINYQNEISPICIPEKGLELPAGTMCYTSGWGTTASGGRTSDELLQVNVPLVSQDVCNQADWYGGAIGDFALCAGYEQGGRDSCQGDSGGPLMCSVGGKWTLIGVVSWGHGCASARKPGVYTKVSYVTDWVHSTINSFDKR